MINAEIMKDAEQRRLAWRCRRGLLELDIVLQRFVNQQFANQQLDGLTLDEMHHFDAMLDWPDNEFWDLIQGIKTQSNQSIQAVLNKLKTSLQASQEAI